MYRPQSVGSHIIAEWKHPCPLLDTQSKQFLSQYKGGFGRTSMHVACRDIHYMRDLMDGSPNSWWLGTMVGQVAAHNSQPLGLRIGEDGCIRFARGVVFIHEGGMGIIIDSLAVERAARIWHCAARVHKAEGGDEMTIGIRIIFIVCHMLINRCTLKSEKLLLISCATIDDHSPCTLLAEK